MYIYITVDGDKVAYKTNFEDLCMYYFILVIIPSWFEDE